VKVGWETKTLGDVCEFQRGLTYAKSDEVDVSENIVLRATNIDLATNLLDFSELKYINEKVVVPASKKVKVGSLMICTASGSKSHLGKVAFIDEDYGYAFGGFMGMVTPCPELQPKYLFYRMTSSDYKDFIAGLSDGANINNLKFDDLQRFSIPYPPLPEQQRIVAILDQAFAAIATARAHAEQNLQNARAVFDSHLQAVFSQRGDGWETVRLSEACLIRPPKSEARQKLDAQAEVSFVPMEDLGIGQKYLEPKKTRLLEDVAGSYTYFADGDVLLAKITPCFENGKLGIARGLKNGVGFGSSEYIVLRPDAKTSPEFIYYYLARAAFFEEGAGKMSGAVGHKRVSKEFIENYPIPVPPLSEQQQIIATLDALREQTQALASLYQRKIAALDALKQSLLHQAFSGAL
jgi:type I restriction enzyme S subunit